MFHFLEDRTGAAECGIYCHYGMIEQVNNTYWASLQRLTSSCACPGAYVTTSSVRAERNGGIVAPMIILAPRDHDELESSYRS